MSLKNRLLESILANNVGQPNPNHIDFTWAAESISPFEFKYQLILDVNLKAQGIYYLNPEEDITKLKAELIKSVLQEIYGDQRNKLIKAMTALHNRDVNEALYILRDVVEEME